MKKLLNMFGLFKKKDPISKLEAQYKELLSESYRLSTTDRTASDQKQVEAEALLQQIQKLKEQMG